MQNQRQYSGNINQEIQNYETIRSIFGADRIYEKIRDNSKFISFANKLNEIQDICKNKYLDLGEALLMLNKSFGYIWDTIPFGKMDEIKQWFINNWFRNYQILEPEKHEQIMKMESPDARQYQDFYNSQGIQGRKLMETIPKIEAWWNKD